MRAELAEEVALRDANLERSLKAEEMVIGRREAGGGEVPEAAHGAALHLVRVQARHRGQTVQVTTKMISRVL